MTLTATVTHRPRITRWSARVYTDADRDQVLAWFAEPDFYYRSAQPDTLPEWEVLDLVGEDDCRVLLADEEPIGLYALEPIGAGHSAHYQLHLRLRAGEPISVWQSAFDEVVRAARWDRELIRLAVLVGEFDPLGLEVVRSLGLTDEGTLEAITVHNGSRHGYAFYSRIWEPQS